MIRSETMSSEESLSAPPPPPPPPPTAEPPGAPSESSEDESPNRSRELKSLLALSKEANLDTNIAHKRKEKVQRRPSSAKCFPVTAEHELEEGTDRPGSASPWKRPRLDSGGSHESGGGGVDKTKGLATLKIFKENKDMFCWRCHRDGVNIACETCPRSYHGRCLKQSIPDADKWLCPECASIMTSESTHNRTLKDVPLGHLCDLLKFALRRMTQCQGSQPFLHPVNEGEFPEYRRYIVRPMDLTEIERNIKGNLYGSTQAFEADSKWLLHNSIIFNSYQSKLTSVAKNIVKVCRQEMAEIENCSNCYLNANTKKDTWFVEVCPKPHLPVWAKLKGFPYWPAKVLSVTSAGMVDVRFFGAHDRAWIPHRDCYLFSEKDPNTFKQRRQDIEDCIEELRLYVANLRAIYGQFRYAPYKVAYDPTDYELQLKMFLPKYKGEKKEESDDKESDDAEGETDDEKTGTTVEMTGTAVEMTGTADEMTGTAVEKAGTTVEDGKKSNCDDEVDDKDRSDDDDDDDDDDSADDEEKSKPNDRDGRPLDGGAESKVKDDGNARSVDGNEEVSANDVDGDDKDEKAKEEEAKKEEGEEAVDMEVEEEGERDEHKNREVEEEEDEEEDEEEEGEDEDPRSENDVSLEKKALRGAPRMRGGIHAPRGRVKVLPRRRSEPPTHRDEDDRSSTSSDDSDRPLASHRASSSSSKKGSEGPVVRVAIDPDAEVTITPKSKISEKLMKILSGGDEESREADGSREADEPMEELRNDRSKLFDIIHSSLNEGEGAEGERERHEDERPSKKRRLSSSDGWTGGRRSTKQVPLPLIDDIKSEPASEEEEEEDDDEEAEDEEEEEENRVENDLEAKKRYLSALNISEKGLAEAAVTALKERTEIRTRAKAEERRERFKVVDNMTKIIDEVAVNYDRPSRRQSAGPPYRKGSGGDGGEIQVKSFAKLKTPENHQRARKSFPTPTYVGKTPSRTSTNKKDAGATNKKDAGASTTTSMKLAVTMNGKVGGGAQAQKATAAPPKPTTEPVATMQHVILLPAPSIGYATTVAGVMPKIQPASQSSMPTLTPGVVSGPSASVLKISQFVPNTKASQNYIPQQDDVVIVAPSAPPAATIPRKPVTLLPKPTSTNQIINQTTNQNNGVESQSQNDEFSIIRGLVPDNVNRALTELLVRPPPKLRPRPPGMLGERFDTGTPSSAGEVAAKVNAIAHRMSDYFRGMLIETLEEFGKESNPEARIARLQLELETLRHKHNVELTEIRRTVCSILKDVQESIALEKEKAIEEARAVCEAETIRRVELAKSKQWCTMCSKEAQFYCCWNTSYCDYPCQQKHWPQHMGKCTQNTEKQTATTGASTTAAVFSTTATTTATAVPLVRASQPIILRPALPPKNAVGRILAKPTRIYMNKSLGPANAKSYKTFTSGNSHITVIETSTGSYELFSSNGLVAGKTMTAPKVASTTTPTPSTSGGGNATENNNAPNV